MFRKILCKDQENENKIELMALTIYGKSLLAKALGISQPVYAASMLTVPESVVNTVQENLFAFLWKNRKDKIKRVVMYQTVKKGGINFANFSRVIKSVSV